MTAPRYSITAETLYERLPDILRVEDERRDWVLKRFLSGMGNQAGIIERLNKRIDYIDPSDRGAPNFDPDDMVETPVHGGIQIGMTPPVFVEEHSGMGVITDPNALEDPPNDTTYVRVGLGATDDDDDMAEVRLDPYTGDTTTLNVHLRLSTSSTTKTPTSRLRLRLGQSSHGGTLGGWFGDSTTLSVDVPNDGSIYEYMFRFIPDTSVISSQTLFKNGAYLNMYVGAESNDTAITIYNLRVYTDLTTVVGTAGEVPYENPDPLARKPVTYGLTSDLVDSRTADYEWLPWLAQVLGVKLDQSRPEQEQRDLLADPDAGHSIGTKEAIANTVKAGLTGSKFCQVYDHTSDTSPKGEATVWDMLVVTKVSEVPDGFDPVEAVNVANNKPAGVVLRHKGFESDWATIEGKFTTWDQWDAATWTDIEEAGLD